MSRLSELWKSRTVRRIRHAAEDAAKQAAVDAVVERLDYLIARGDARALAVKILLELASARALEQSGRKAAASGKIAKLGTDLERALACQ